MRYRRAKEVERVAKDLIGDHHELLRNHGPNIVYVMTETPKNPDSGKDYAIRKVTGINAFLAKARLPEDFDHADGDLVAIEIKESFWNRLAFAGRLGLVDHLLHYLVPDLDKDTWIIEPPEFGEFPEVLRQHGFWRPDKRIKSLATVMSDQLSLLDEEDEDEEDGIEEAIENMRPDADSGLDSVTISTGEVSTTLSKK